VILLKKYQIFLQKIFDDYMKYSLLPSLPATSFQQILDLTEKLKDTISAFQVDIVDGVFAPHRAWPFTESDVLSEWQKLSELVAHFEIEIDCMVQKPEQYLDIFSSLKVSRVIIHIGSTDCYGHCIRHARAHGYKVGFAFTNDVPLSFMYPYIELIDFVQIMGIKNIGQQGQPFDEQTLVTAKKLRDAYPNLEIAVDGGVNEETIIHLKKAGVNRFAPGSVISGAADPVVAYKHLVSLIT